MESETRVAAIVAGLMTMTLVAGCSVHGTVGRQDLTASSHTRYQGFGRKPGQTVSAYTTTDGRVRSGIHQAWIEGDSIVFERRHKRHRVALADIASVEAEEVDAGRSVAWIFGFLAMAAGLALGVAFTSGAL